MKRTVTRFVKLLGMLLSFPLLYLVVALVLTYIPVSETNTSQAKDLTIFLSTNGVHLDIILPTDYLSQGLSNGLTYKSNTQYLAFGWGDRDFYLNTPTWNDLRLSTAINALFLTSETLMHVSHYASKRASWVAVALSQDQLTQINAYLLEGFQNIDGQKVLLANQGYGSHDDFYVAQGSYSCFKTCNTWVNQGFKQIGLKACLWTPFDFGLLNTYSHENR